MRPSGSLGKRRRRRSRRFKETLRGSRSLARSSRHRSRGTSKAAGQEGKAKSGALAPWGICPSSHLLEGPSFGHPPGAQVQKRLDGRRGGSGKGGGGGGGAWSRIGLLPRGAAPALSGRKLHRPGRSPASPEHLPENPPVAARAQPGQLVVSLSVGGGYGPFKELPQQ